MFSRILAGHSSPAASFGASTRHASQGQGTYPADFTSIIVEAGKRIPSESKPKQINTLRGEAGLEKGKCVNDIISSGPGPVGRGVEGWLLRFGVIRSMICPPPPPLSLPCAGYERAFSLTSVKEIKNNYAFPGEEAPNDNFRSDFQEKTSKEFLFTSTTDI